MSQPQGFGKVKNWAGRLADRLAGPGTKPGVRDALGVIFSEDQQEKRMKGGEALDWLDDDQVIELTRHYFGRNMAYMELGEINKQNAWLHRKYRAMNIIVLAYQDAMDNLCFKVAVRSHNRCKGTITEAKMKSPVAMETKVDAATGKSVMVVTEWADVTNLVCSICKNRDGSPVVVGKAETTKETVYQVRDPVHDTATVDSWKHVLAMVGRQMLPYTFKDKHLNVTPIAITGQQLMSQGDEGGDLLRALMKDQAGGQAS